MATDKHSHSVGLEFNQTFCGISAAIAALAVFLFTGTAEIGNPLLAALLAAAVGYGIANASQKGGAIIITLGAIVAYLSYIALDGHSFASKLNHLTNNVKHLVN